MTAFDYTAWNAPELIEGETLKQFLAEIKQRLTGKKLMNIFSVGQRFFHEKPKRYRDCYEELDGPLILVFDDLSLEIGVGFTSRVKIGINTLPQDISSKRSFAPEFSRDGLAELIWGHEVTFFDVKKYSMGINDKGGLGHRPYEGDYFEKIIITMDNGCQIFVKSDDAHLKMEVSRNLLGDYISTDERLIAGIVSSSYYWFVPYNFDIYGRAEGISIEEDDAQTLLLIMMCVDKKVDQYENRCLSKEKWQKIIELWHFVLFQAESFDQVFEKLLRVDYKRRVVGREHTLYFMNNYGKQMCDNRVAERPLYENFKKWFDLVAKHYDGMVFVGL